jgi:Concanavalin A-like lectin/glucanases superfamily/FG-GAP repeat
MQVTQHLIHSYLDQLHYRHPAVVRHQGHVIVLAMDVGRRIKYTVLDLREDNGAHDLLAVHAYLERMAPLDFPATFVRVRHGAGEVTRLPAVIGDPFLASTARFTADAPFQVLSDGADLYLLRQSLAGNHPDMADNTLLLDRYVVAGTTLQLKSTAPDYAPESTSVLDFVQHLHAGRFAAMLLPTSEATITRWQIFAYNWQRRCIDAFNVARSADGRCDPTGEAFIGRQPTTLQGESAVQFTMDDTYVDCGTGLDLRETDFTIELWARRTMSEGGNQVALAHGQGDKRSPLLQIGFRATNQFTFAFAAGDVLSTPRRFRGTDWHHWACVYTHAERRREIYCDGTRVIGNTAKTPYQGTGPFVIGKAPWGEGWRGHIDEVRVWKRARSVEDIQNDWLHRLVGDEPGLAAYWRFDEGAGDMTRDQTDNAHHGTLHGNTNDAMWVTSSAPVRDHARLDRSSFALAGRTIASGLSALLYVPQEGAQTTATPDLARVLLAVATGDATADGEPTAQPSVALVDFAVSPHGTLGRVPHTLALPAVTADVTAINALRQHEQRETELQALITQGFVRQDPPLAASHTQTHAYFGGAVAISGDWAIVGAHEASPDGIAYAGSAEVFHREANGTWAKKATLTAHEKQENANFGVAVAISGEWALVGAYEASPHGVDYAGSADVFRLEADGTWAHRQTLTARDQAAGAHFGVAVALDGKSAIVGADTADADGVAAAGKVYVFQLQDDGSWAERGHLVASDKRAYAGFGSAVALSGSWALIGAYGASPDELTEAGSAYVFQHNGVQWIDKSPLTARNKQARAYFGSAVALSGEWALVGADREDVDGTPHAGCVHVFRLTGEEWVEQPPLTPSPIQAHAHFGRAVGISDRWAVVGAEQPDSLATNRVGRAYIFQRANGMWVAKPPLAPHAPQAYPSFSSAVALSADRAVIGAPREGANDTPQAGRAYVYDAALTARLADLEREQADVQGLQAGIGNAAQPLPLLHRAPSGLAVYGGVLGVAPLEGTPSLVDGATGARLWPALLGQHIARQP